MKGFGSSGAGAAGTAGGTLPAGTAAGQTLVWDGVSLWVPSAPVIGAFFEGSIGLTALASQFFGAATYGVGGQATEAAAGEFMLPFDCVIDRFGARHANAAAGTANPVTYFMRFDGIDSPLTVSGNTNNAGPFTDLVNTFSYSAFQRISVRASWPTALVQQIRPHWTVRLTAV